MGATWNRCWLVGSLVLGGACGAPEDEASERLVGSYAMRVVNATVQEVPIVGQVPGTTTTVSLAEVRREGGQLRLRSQGCRVRVHGAPGITTTIPDAVPRSTEVLEAPLVVGRQGEVLRWSWPESVTVLGARLADPERDQLPTTEMDPRVFDQDRDGKPGVTVRITSAFGSGDIYLVQRQRLALGGTVMGDDLVGLSMERAEQAVVGASNPLLRQNVRIDPDPDPNKSTVHLVRLRAAYDCDRLLTEETALFR